MARLTAAHSQSVVIYGAASQEPEDGAATTVFVGRSDATQEVVREISGAEAVLVADPATFPFTRVLGDPSAPPILVVVDGLAPAHLDPLLRVGELSRLTPADALLSTDRERLRELSSWLGPERVGYVDVTAGGLQEPATLASSIINDSRARESACLRAGLAPWLAEGPNTRGTRRSLVAVSATLSSFLADIAAERPETVIELTQAGRRGERWRHCHPEQYVASLVDDVPVSEPADLVASFFELDPNDRAVRIDQLTELWEMVCTGGSLVLAVVVVPGADDPLGALDHQQLLQDVAEAGGHQALLTDLRSAPIDDQPAHRMALVRFVKVGP